MVLLTDISRAIERQHAQDLLAARRIIAEIQHLGPRVVRCVLYLADGDLQKLEHFTDQALQDPRDVMYWAEYDRDSNDQVRDFNEPFE